MELLRPDTLRDTESSLANTIHGLVSLQYFKWREGIEVKWTVQGAELTGTTDEQINSLVATCVQKRCYHSAFILAVYRYGIEEAMKRIPDQETPFWDMWMERFMLREEWANMRMVFSTFPTYNCAIVLGNLLTLFRTRRDLRGEVSALARTILRRCPEAELLTFQNLRNSFNFEMLLYADDMDARRAFGWMVSTPQSIAHPNADGLDILRDPFFLRAACESGLLAVARKAFSDSDYYLLAARAVNTNQLYFVTVLYDQGLMNSHSLFRLSKLKSEEVDREEETVKKFNLPSGSWAATELEQMKAIRDFLRSKAPHPRSLQTLCLLEVRTHMGWGCVRDGNVDSLPIPSGFRDKLKNARAQQ